MMILLGYLYFAVLIFAAYKIGSKGAGRGVALFIVGALVFVIASDGPGALLDGPGCQRYSSTAQDC